MTLCGSVSAASFGCQSNRIAIGNFHSAASKCGYRDTLDQNNILAFRVSESIGDGLRIPEARAVKIRSRNGARPLQVCFSRVGVLVLGKGKDLSVVIATLVLVVQVVCVDYPRPELDNTLNFLEAAYLSSSFRTSPRPSRPLKIVIAGAGERILSSTSASTVPLLFLGIW